MRATTIRPHGRLITIKQAESEYGLPAALTLRSAANGRSLPAALAPGARSDEAALEAAEERAAIQAEACHWSGKP